MALLSIQLRELEQAQAQEPLSRSPDASQALFELDRKSEADFVQLLMAVVMVDGLTKNVELRGIRQYFQETLKYDGEDLKRIDNLVQKAQEDDHEPDPRRLARPFLSRPTDERRHIYGACIAIAFADDEIVEEERGLLAALADLLQIDATQSAAAHEIHTRASQERQQSFELKVRGQFPVENAVRFEASEPPPPSRSTIAPEVLDKTIELMAIHLVQKKGRCNTADADWSRFWRGCPEVEAPDIASVLRGRDVLKVLSSGEFELATALDQRKQVEARLFSFLVNSNQPISLRLVARTQNADPRRAIQLLCKYVRECPAFVAYNYGCGTWFGLALWGRRGYEETVRQNLGEIRKQIEAGGRSVLSDVELDVLREVASSKDKVLLELLN